MDAFRFYGAKRAFDRIFDNGNISHEDEDNEEDFPDYGKDIYFYKTWFRPIRPSLM